MRLLAAGCFLLLSLGSSPLHAGGWDHVSNTSLHRNARIVAQQETVFLFDDEHVVASSDRGRSWAEQQGQFSRGIIATYTCGFVIGSFTPGSKAGTVEHFRSTDKGRSWQYLSSFRIGEGDTVVDASLVCRQPFVYTRMGAMYVTTDQGYTWEERHLPAETGEILDVAATADILVVTGTQGTMWSANKGQSWVPTYPPTQVGGSIRILREHEGTIWGGGLTGMCRFDAQSRSWSLASDGLPEFGRLTASPTSLLSQSGVLFGCFRSGSGYDHIMRWSEPAMCWVPINNEGLPPQNKTTRGNLACDGPRLYLYVNGDDVNFLGVYTTLHNAILDVHEGARERTLDLLPNPASYFVQINLPEGEASSVWFCDQAGNFVQRIAGEGTMRVDVRCMPAGKYHLTCETSGLKRYGSVRVVR